MDINCNSNEYILIGWSHYGTKKSFRRVNSSSNCEPLETDCIMDYTHKIAELCNGASKCEVILTQQFIHKCSDEATYLFISYQCIQNSTIVDICSQRSITSLNAISVISPMFPNEYPNNINCTCSVESKAKSNVIIDVESLSFNLQDNDNLLSFSGTIPFGASLLTVKNQLDLKFQTDETLSQSGFWIRLYGYEQCYDDEYVLGSKCIKVFSRKQTWKSAKEKCLSINSNLIRLNDIIQEKKLAYFILTNNQQQSTSFWISNEKENYDKEIASKISEKIFFVGPSSSTVKNELKHRTNTIDPNVLAVILTGIAIVIFFVNIVVCYIFRKRPQDPSKFTAQHDSSSSFIHEELQHSLMQHIYHEQTNTISSRSISSSSSKNSQSKSNDTTTTASTNLFQLSSVIHPSNSFRTDTASKPLCFRNPHVCNDSVDYHVYETIPSENSIYTFCAAHSAFKPVVQSNTHTIRPYLSQANTLQRHLSSSQESYDKLSSILPNATVVMPICCHLYSPQCPTETLRQNLRAISAQVETQEPIYNRSESIV
ncbi:unnamed protein product [Rotaria magnacalcarata]|uniref:CUB domain-containing protein n=1 Tax=Rotaria magnacalcarata TaxID=392030 RepID=A0A8S2IMS3_9BILA|nr:unnamed protein product [Rotaria magnacalcarata]